MDSGTGKWDKRDMSVKVSVLLPVWNEEQWLRKRIDSILSQDWEDFELIISDNASTDRTEDICRYYAKTDRRIKYWRQKDNIGGAKNFEFTLEQSLGEYVTFAGGHDLWSSNYIRALKEKLDAKQKVVVSFAKVAWIDSDDNPLEKHRGIYCTEGVSSPIRRFNLYMWADQNPIYGMMRREPASEAWPTNDYIVGGQIFLQRMAILGQFAYVPEATFYRRENRKKETREERLARYQSSLFDKRGGVRRRFWKSAFAVVSSAWKYPLPGRGLRRIRLRFQMVASSFTVFIRFWPSLWSSGKK